MLFAVANGGTIAALSVASAAYAAQVFPIVSQEHVVLSLVGITITRAHVFGLLLIAILTCVNVIGFLWGSLLQNLSTWSKFSAIAAFVGRGFASLNCDWSHF